MFTDLQAEMARAGGDMGTIAGARSLVDTMYVSRMMRGIVPALAVALASEPATVGNGFGRYLTRAALREHAQGEA